MNIDVMLEKVGLTKQEAKVYLALLELQESRTGSLCKYSKIASSNIYNILDSLIKKGLVNYRMQNNIKVFMPSPPEALNELFLEKQRKLDEEREQVTELISKLKKKKVKQEPHSNYKYFEGIPGIKSMWHEINSIMSADNVIKVHTGRKGSYERLVGFYNHHHELRAKKKVPERLIFPQEEVELAKKRRI